MTIPRNQQPRTQARPRWALLWRLSALVLARQIELRCSNANDLTDLLAK